VETLHPTTDAGLNMVDILLFSHHRPFHRWSYTTKSR